MPSATACWAGRLPGEKISVAEAHGPPGAEIRGTSVGNVERIKAVADRIGRCREEGHDVVVVVSAMGHTTDELTGLANAITSTPTQREMDMLLASGEQVSIALLAMALNAQGVSATSMTGLQVAIATESTHGRARSSGSAPSATASVLARWWWSPASRAPALAAMGSTKSPPWGAGSDTSLSPWRRPWGRCLRDLHRRSRCAQHRPAQGARCPADGHDQLRRNAGTRQPGGLRAPSRAVEIARNYVNLVVRSSWSDAPASGSPAVQPVRSAVAAWSSAALWMGWRKSTARPCSPSPTPRSTGHCRDCSKPSLKRESSDHSGHP